MFKIIILLAIVLLNTSCFAQIKKSFTIKLKLPTIKTTQNLGVVLLQKNDVSNILDFKTGDSKNSFVFEIDNQLYDSVYVAVQDLYFASDTILIACKDKATYNVVVYEKSKLIDINEIVVTSKIKVSNDTIRFDAAEYNTAEVFKTEDLLKKIKGFTVDEDGTIKYNNVPIKQLMVNGKNVSPDNYKIISKNLNSSTIKEIQAIKNFNDNRLLAPTYQTKDVAINLVLKKDFIFSPSVDVALGNNKRALLNGAALAFNKKLKLVTSINTNNIAENIETHQSGNSMVTNYDGTEFKLKAAPFESNIVNQHLLNASTIGKPMLPIKYVANNNTISLSNNLSFTLRKHLNVNLGYSLNNNKLINKANNATTINIANNIIQSTLDTLTSNFNEQLSIGSLRLGYDNKKKLIINSTIKLMNSEVNGSFTNFTKGSFNDTLNENALLKQLELSIENSFTIALKKEKLLILTTSHSINKYKDVIGSVSNKLNGYFNNLSFNITPLQQLVNYNLSSHNLDANIYKPRETQKFNIGFAAAYNTLTPTSTLYYNSNLTWQLSEKLTSSNQYVYYKNTAKLAKRLTLNAEAKFGLGTSNAVKNNLKITKPIYAAEINFGYKKTKGETSLTLKSETNLPNILGMAQIKYLQNTSSLFNGGAINQTFTTHSVSLRTNKRVNYITNFSLNLSADYKPKVLANNFIFDNGLSVSSFYIANSNKNGAFSGSLDRYSFLFKTKFFLDVSANVGVLNLVQNNLPQKINSTNYAIAYKMVTNFLKFPNFEYAIKYNKAISKQTTANKSLAFSFSNIDMHLKTLISIAPKLNFANTMQYLINNNTKPILLQQMALGYITKNKHIKLEASLHNLWNYKNYNSQNVSSFYQAQTNFALMPRYGLFKVYYQF